MRVKPRSLYRGLYFSKKPQTYFPAVTLRQQGEDSRLCRARRHFAGGLDSREADRKAGLHKHSGASGLKIRARCLTQQQPWALKGLGNSLLRQTHWLTSQRLPTILSEWQETAPPPPAPGPWDPLLLLVHLVHRNHRGQASVWVVLQAHPHRGNKIQSLHPPLNTGRLHHPLSKSLEGAGTQAPSRV